MRFSNSCRFSTLLLLILFCAFPCAGQPLPNDSFFSSESSELASELYSLDRGLNSTVIETLKTIPRHRFLGEAYFSIAYDNIAAPGFDGNIVPSPADIAAAISLLSPDSSDRILVAGSNAGYAAAILSRLCSEVYLIEESSGASVYGYLFDELGINNVFIAEKADIREFGDIIAFDKIFIHAAVSEISETVTERLAIQGNITFVLSIKDGFQQIISLRRSLLGDSIICAGSCYYPVIKTLKIGN